MNFPPGAVHGTQSSDLSEAAVPATLAGVQPARRTRGRLFHAILGLGLVGLVCGGGAIATLAVTSSSSAPRISSFRGARLGMTARDVRDHYEPERPGRWQTVADPGELVLAWAADQGESRARFEFHAGMLVAVRAIVGRDDALASGAAIETSPAAVLTRVPADPAADVRVTILARDCPTHAAEVQRALAAKSAR